MASHTRIVNISRNCRMSLSQALAKIAACLCAWVEEGVSVRDLTLAEMVAARSEQARKNAPLDPAEIRGVRFELFDYESAAVREERAMAAEAYQFAASPKTYRPSVGCARHSEGMACGARGR